MCTTTMPQATTSMACDTCCRRRRTYRRSPFSPYVPAGRGRAVLFLSMMMASVLFLSPRVTEGKDTPTIAAGFQHSCVITGDATIKCFGSNDHGKLGTGDDLDRGTGANNAGEMGDMLPEVNLGAGETAVAVSAAYSHTCALLESGEVKCWGRNDWGQLGQGDYVNRGANASSMGSNLAPIDLGTAPSGTGAAVAIGVTTGDQFTCVLIEGGGVKCFGRNDEGQCGRGDLEESVGSNEADMGDNLPYVSLGTGVEAQSISSGTASTCASLVGGGIKCWGGNAYGGLGLEDSYNRGDGFLPMGDGLPEVDLGTGEVALTVFYGLRHACAILVGGAVKCWGDNRSGQLGNGNVNTIGDDVGEMGDGLPFVDLGTGEFATTLTLGESHTCAILAGDGTVRCWGKSFAGQLATGHYHAKGKYPGEMGAGLTAVDLGTGLAAAGVTAGADHTCAVLDNGSLKCWGLNTVGALGLDDTLARGDAPGEMGDNLPAVSLGTGVTVAADALPTMAPTGAPTPAPISPSPAPTASATEKQSPTPAAAADTPAPTATSRGGVGGDGATPAPGVGGVDGAGGIDGESDDSGFLTSKNMTFTAYVAAPILAFVILACLCARRRYRQRDQNSASVGARESYQKGGEVIGLGGLGGHADVDGRKGSDVGNRSAIILPLSMRAAADDEFCYAGAGGGVNGSQAGSTRVLPQSQSFSAPVGAGDSVVTAAIAGTGGGRAPASGSEPVPDYAFAVTTASSFASDQGEVESGGGGDGTGRSNSPSEQGNGSDGSYVESELDANGWGSGRSQSGLGSLTGSYRERNSDRTLARAKHAGRPGVPRRAQVPSAIAAAAHDDESSRVTSL